MFKSILLAASAGLIVASAGCVGINRRLSEHIIRKGRAKRTLTAGYMAEIRYRLDNAALAKMMFAGQVRSAGITVTYQRGLQSQAQCIAEEVGDNDRPNGRLLSLADMPSF